MVFFLFIFFIYLNPLWAQQAEHEDGVEFISDVDVTQDSQQPKFPEEEDLITSDSSFLERDLAAVKKRIIKKIVFSRTK